MPEEGSRRRAHILAVDHLGEPDDRVEWSPELVDQLAQRIRREASAEQADRVGLRRAARDLVDSRTARASAVTEEASLSRIEKWHARYAPVARSGTASGDTETRVAERSSLLERARRLPVDSVLAELGDRRDSLTDQRSARGSVDPDDHPVGARLPLEAVGFHDSGARRNCAGLALAAESLDARDEIANLGFAALASGARARKRRLDCEHMNGSVGNWRLAGGGFFDCSGEGEIARSKTGQAILHGGRKVAPVTEQTATGRAEPREQIEPRLGIEPNAADQRRRDSGKIFSEETDQPRRDSVPAKRSGRFLAHRHRNRFARPAKPIEGVVDLGGIGPATLGQQVDQLSPLRCQGRAMVAALRQNRGDHVVEPQARLSLNRASRFRLHQSLTRRTRTRKRDFQRVAIWDANPGSSGTKKGRQGQARRPSWVPGARFRRRG